MPCNWIVPGGKEFVKCANLDGVTVTDFWLK